MYEYHNNFDSNIPQGKCFQHKQIHSAVSYASISFTNFLIELLFFTFCLKIKSKSEFF